MASPDSPFLSVPSSEWVASSDLAFAIRDRYPVSPGHTLVVPRRLVATWFEATPEEQQALLRLVDEVKRTLDGELQPDGYNVGFNAGAAAGQTVMHLHVHVIPRFHGDMDDPSGGVRHVIPSRGNYRRQPGGFAERTVSVTDLAWALCADEDVRAQGGVLDEARVNRLRYLDGTPKSATRWIDTGWALGLLKAAASKSK